MFQFLAEIAIGVVSKVPGPGLGEFFGWVCAAQDSKKKKSKISPKIDTPF